jgi:hypothetical protein
MSLTPLVSHQLSIHKPRTAGNICVSEILGWISSGKYSEEVREIRKAVAADPTKNELNLLKGRLLPTYSPHGTFRYRNDQGILTESNITFIDIDGTSNQAYNTDEIKDKLINLEFVFAAYLSSTGTGVHALAATDSIRDDYQVRTISEVSTIVYELVKSKTGLVCDESCRDISRACFISHDEDLFFDRDRLPRVTNVQVENEEKRYHSVRNSPTGKGITNQTIPFRARGVIGEFDFNGDSALLIDEGAPYFDVYLPDIRVGHRKKSMYYALAQFCIGNPHSGLQGITHTANYLNTRLEKQLTEHELKGIINSIWKRKNKQGFITTKKKKIVYNEDVNLTAKDKRTLSCKLIGKERTKKTMDRIEQALKELSKSGKKITQKAVAEKTGLSIITVKRNWKK